MKLAAVASAHPTPALRAATYPNLVTTRGSPTHSPIAL